MMRFGAIGASSTVETGAGGSPIAGMVRLGTAAIVRVCWQVLIGGRGRRFS